MSRKLITLEGLAEFKRNMDKIVKKLTVIAQTFDPNTGAPTFSSNDIKTIIEERPDVIRVGIVGYSDYMFMFPSWTWDDDDLDPTHCEYIHIEVDNTFNVIYYAFVKNGNEYTCTVSTKALDEGGSGSDGATKGEFDISGNSDEWTQEQLQDVFENQYDVISITTSQMVLTIHKVVDLSSVNQVAYFGFSPNSSGILGWSFYHDAESDPQYGVMDMVLAPIVQGQNDGTNWTELTIGEDTYAIPQGGSGSSDISKLTLDAQEFDPQTGLPTETALNDVIDNKYDVIEIINAPGISNEMFYLDTYNTYNNKIMARYVCRTSTGDNDVSLVAFEITRLDGSNTPTLKICMPDFEVVEANPALDGTEPTLTGLKVGGYKYAIPQGGGGGGSDEIYPIAITATPSSTNIELAAAQNLTLASMPDAPGYTFAAYTLNAGLSYNKPYDAVLAEFGAGHQYLLQLISADSSMLMYGIEESGMPVFDDDHPCAILIQLNNGAIDGAMMVSGGTYGPDGSLIATSLKGYFYSDTEFSYNASGIRDTDIAAAISAGKLPVAIISWKYKDYTSWCPIKSFDEEDYYFEGEYKENAFRLECDGSYWRVNWLPVYVEDKELDVYIDYSNNLVYFRSLNDLRDAQSGLAMLRLKLYDNTTHDYLGKLELTLTSQNAAGTENYYSSTQVDNGDVKVTTILVTSSNTLPGGSTLYIATLTPVAM